MTHKEFQATLKLLKWRKIDNDSFNKVYKNETNELKIIAQNEYAIHIRQYVYTDNIDKPSYTNGLCTCNSYEETIDYITNLDMNNLPPNGKNK